jgi:hypothetical protein
MLAVDVTVQSGESGYDHLKFVRQQLSHVIVSPPLLIAAAAAAGIIRYLLLDGRSNTELSGVKALRRLSGLRALVLPLLHLQHADRGLLAGLALALPHTLLANISTNFGSHHGCQVGKTSLSRVDFVFSWGG